MQELIKNSARATVEVRRRLLEIAGEIRGDQGIHHIIHILPEMTVDIDNTRGNHQELALEPSWLSFGLRIIINYPHRGLQRHNKQIFKVFSLARCRF